MILIQLTPIPLVFVALLGIFWAIEEGPENLLAACLGIASVLLLLTSLATFFRDVHFFEGLLPYWRARASFTRRPDAWVRPDEPEVVFVDVIPRANWARTMVENASDLGFLRVDESRRQILFEGDRQRYRIPAARITGLEITGLGHSVRMMGMEISLRQVVVLHVNTPQGPVEIPLVIRHVPLLATLRWGRGGNFDRLTSALFAILPFDTSTELDSDPSDLPESNR